MLGRDDLVDKYEDEVLEKVINPVEDFEVTRYAHNDWFKENKLNTSIEYKFSFFDRNGEISDLNNSLTNYINDYVFTENPDFTGTCFTEAEVYYFANSFKRSFFKLDLYDTPDSETQKLYLSIIIPTQQSETRSSNTEPIESNGQVDGPTLPAVMPQGAGARNAVSNYRTSVIVEDSTVSEIDSLVPFGPCYKATFTSCDSFVTYRDLAINTFNTMDYPNTTYTIQVNNVCYELTDVDTGTTIPEADLNIYIDSLSQLGTGGCNCPNLPPTATPQVSSPPSGGLPVLPPEDCGLNPGVSNTPNLSNTPTPSVTPSVQSEGSGGDINDNPQGIGEGEDSSPITAPPDVEIKIPHFILDFIGDKEGYFIYWLKNPNYVAIDTFYMGAKFFNAKTGQFVRFLNEPQTNFSQRFTFDKSKYFYYKVELDTENYVYEVKDTESNIRVGAGGAINWYEYVNPS